MPPRITEIKTPPTKKELADRLEKVRLLMEQESLDYYLAAQTENVYYLTNFAYYPMERPFFLLIPIKGRPTLVLPRLEVSHARDRVLADVDYRTYAEYPAPKGETHLDVLNDLMDGNKHVGVESSLPLDHSATVPGKLVTLDLIEETRLVKSDYEIGRIAYACKVVEAGLAKVLELSKPGVQVVTIYGEGVRLMTGTVILEVPNVNMLVNKFVCAVWPKAISAQPHSIPGLFDALEPGGPQVTIVTAQADGYSAELERTFFLGEVPEKAKAPFEAMMEARALAFKLIRPGVPAEDVDRQVLELIRAKGYGEGILHRTGHGFGITGHERPWIAMGGDDVFEKNMVVSIEPGIYIPGLGGFRHSDTVLVTGDGCAAMTKGPDRLEDLVLAV